MIRASLIVSMALWMTGCASNGAKAPPPVSEVLIPVPIPCRSAVPNAPAFAVDALPVGSGVWAQMAALRADRKQRMGYEGELLAALRACIGVDAEKAERLGGKAAAN